MADQTRDVTNEPKSAAEIERDIDRTRAEIDVTLDRIFDRLTPGEMFEQALAYLRNSHGFARFGAAVRDNPVPAVLAAVGIGWLVIAGMRTGPEDVGRARRPLPRPRYPEPRVLARDTGEVGASRPPPDEVERPMAAP